MTCANPTCGNDLAGAILRCMSNTSGEDGTPATCGNRVCPGLRFCSSRCVNACWRQNNMTFSYVPEVVREGRIITPAQADAEDAVAEAERIAEMAYLGWKFGLS